jgi:hypothetical protein
MTIIYVYNGQDGKLSHITSHAVEGVRVIIVDDSGIKDTKEAYNQAVANSDGWIVLANILRVVDRDRIEELLKMEKEKGVVYLLDNGNAKLVHKDDYPNIDELKVIETKILFDLWDTQVSSPPRLDKDAVNSRLDKISSIVDVMEVDK